MAALREAGQVACGNGHCAAVDRSGNLFAFGRALARPDLEARLVLRAFRRTRCLKLRASQASYM